MHTVTFFDGEEWHDGVIELVDGRMLLHDERATTRESAALPRLEGRIVGGLTDHHVHLQLVERDDLTSSALGRVIDLGADPVTISRFAADAADLTRIAAHDGIVVEYAGAFLTAPGGYPSDRPWAPEGSFREAGDAEQLARAVEEMADAGARCIKVASNTIAGPVFGDELLRTIVALSASRGLPVVAHAEGPREAQRMARLGAARLAHAPFTEPLDDDEIAAQAASVAWISTLAIHDDPARAIAIDNVRRFHAAGGIVLYGTDMGNGPTPVGLHPAEIAALREAGLDDTALLRALAPLDPRDPASPLLLVPAPPATDVPLDLLGARRLLPADLKV